MLKTLPMQLIPFHKVTVRAVRASDVLGPLDCCTAEPPWPRLERVTPSTTSATKSNEVGSPHENR
jgi:hypothetical protein